MAILKHISVKNRFYSDAVEYLTCQFDEYTNQPVLDEKGRIMERENYLIAGVNCDVDSFGAECIETNRFYGKNNSDFQMWKKKVANIGRFMVGYG